MIWIKNRKAERISAAIDRVMQKQRARNNEQAKREAVIGAKSEYKKEGKNEKS